jgi:hypothetical protein
MIPQDARRRLRSKITVIITSLYRELLLIRDTCPEVFTYAGLPCTRQLDSIAFLKKEETR